MRIIKSRKPLKEKRTICNQCESELAYVEKDIHTYLGNMFHKHTNLNWNRAGVESSIRIGYKYINCPICHNIMKIKPLVEQFD